MDKIKKSVLIVSSDADFTEQMKSALGNNPETRISSQNASFKGLNGKASKLALESDVVVFDADPANLEETGAISDLLQNNPHDAVFVALTDNEVSLIEARKLQGLGIDEVLPRSISGDDLNTIIHGAVVARKQPVAASGGAHEGTLISIAQSRGGIGATSLAVNLARALAEEKKTFSKSRKNRVALIDLDLQFGDANVLLDLEDNGAFQALLESGENPDSAYVLGMLQKHSSGLEVLNAPAAIAPLNSLHSELLATMLRHLKAEFDYVIADLPHALVDWIEPVLLQSDKMLLITDTSVPSIRQVKRLTDFYKESNVGLSVDLVVNFEQKPAWKSKHHKDAEAALEAKFRHWVPDNPKLMRRAADLGQPVIDVAPRSDIGKAISTIAQQLRETFPTHAIRQKGA